MQPDWPINYSMVPWGPFRTPPHGTYTQEGHLGV